LDNKAVTVQSEAVRMCKCTTPVVSNLAQDGTELLASRPDQFTAKEEAHIPIV
jgi:hypothetical protein